MSHQNSNNTLAAASHLGWIVPVPCLVTGAIYFMNKGSAVGEHARQGLFYQLITLLVGIAVCSVSFLLTSILPAALSSLISLAITLACLALLIPPVKGALAAFQGDSYKYPVIGEMAGLLPI